MSRCAVSTEHCASVAYFDEVRWPCQSSSIRSRTSRWRAFTLTRDAARRWRGRSRRSPPPGPAPRAWWSMPTTRRIRSPSANGARSGISSPPSRSASSRASALRRCRSCSQSWRTCGACASICHSAVIMAHGEPRRLGRRPTSAGGARMRSQPLAVAAAAAVQPARLGGVAPTRSVVQRTHQHRRAHPRAGWLVPRPRQPVQKVGVVSAKCPAWATRDRLFTLEAQWRWRPERPRP